MVAEVALAVVLLCCALLLVRSFLALHHVSLGFDPKQLLTGRVDSGIDSEPDAVDSKEAFDGKTPRIRAGSAHLPSRLGLGVSLKRKYGGPAPVQTHEGAEIPPRRRVGHRSIKDNACDIQQHVCSP